MDAAEQVAPEEIEAQVFRDLEAALPAPDRAHLGLWVLEVGGATLELLARHPNIAEFNRAVGLGTRRPVTPEDLADIRTAARQRGVPQIMLGVHPLARPADLEARLCGLGATPVRTLVVLGRRTESPPTAPADIEVRRAGPEQLDAYMAVFTHGFGMPGDFHPIAQGGFRRPGWQHYLAYQGGEVVGCGGLGLYGGFGWLGNATTLPAFRRRGVQTALIARRVQDAALAGAGRVFSQVAESLPDKPNPSEHNLRRAGFETMYRRPNYLLSTG